ncbi:MAG: hypothetical protein HUK26_09980, partial [Duodenibacillus sp.]|nr:hypothetical protein [Duodenibacillus sp.]
MQLNGDPDLLAQDIFHEDLELLVRNAFLLLDHAGRILADPALACAPVRVDYLWSSSDLPLLGSYRRWWLASEEGWLHLGRQPLAWAAFLPDQRTRGCKSLFLPSYGPADCWIASPTGARLQLLECGINPLIDYWCPLYSGPSFGWLAPDPMHKFFMRDFWKIDRALRSAHP